MSILNHWFHTSSDSHICTAYLIDIWKRSRYIDTIKVPETRLIFTGLRIDMNPFSTYMRKKIIGTSTCPLCISGYDSMSHLFFECPIFDDKPKMMCNAIERHTPTWSHMDVDERLKYLLDLKCPDNALDRCCAYVYDLYVSREKMHRIISGSVPWKQTFNCLSSPE